MSAVISDQTYSPEAYLALERAAAFKSEFHDGHIYAMTGASREHNLVSVNICREMSLRLKDRPREVYINDMRVRAAESRDYFYPDVVLVCDQPEFEDEKLDTLLNPSLLIEVLSPSTEAYDRGGKFARYRKIPSVREYLLVSQDQARIERYVRQGDHWLMTEAVGLEASMVLETVECTLALREVYDKVLAGAQAE
ncbi:MAG: Uma2 family endonuclease [Pseudomonadota bacterium]|nr:Uma2 family endonuclease [Gammaproteobacteria bacterium]MDQ3581527.1 Uma2 family endonuclease [Pseudomonadota bacterium]